MLRLDVLELVVLELNEVELIALGLMFEPGVFILVALELKARVVLESVVADEFVPMLEGSRLDIRDFGDILNSVTLLKTGLVDDRFGGLDDKAVTVVDEFDGPVVVAIELEEGVSVS